MDKKAVEKAEKDRVKAEKEAAKAAAKVEKEATKAAAKVEKEAAKAAAKEAAKEAKLAKSAAKNVGSVASPTSTSAVTASQPTERCDTDPTLPSPAPPGILDVAARTAPVLSDSVGEVTLVKAKSASNESLPPPPPSRVLLAVAEDVVAGDHQRGDVTGDVRLRPKSLLSRRPPSVRQSSFGAPALVVPGVSNLSAPPATRRRSSVASAPVLVSGAGANGADPVAAADIAAVDDGDAHGDEEEEVEEDAVEELDVIEAQEDEEVGTMTASDAMQTVRFLGATLAALRDNFIEPLSSGGSNAGFIAAYLAMADVGLAQASVVSQRAGNLLKNRYGNILAYDHSRVVLPQVDGDADSDYINANFVPGYKRDRAYIASQGPVPSSFISFWRMIWLEKVEVIAMVTHEVEQGRMKCHRYWPDSTSSPPAVKLQFGDVVVTHLSTEPHKHFTVREFAVEYNNEKRLVKHFAYTSWPDHGVPLTTAELLGFRNAVKAAARDPDAPLLIHCSAGVGRTGTYIAIDHLMEQCLDMGGALDVDAVVRSMRMARNFMVQTEVQYIFIFRAVYDAVSELLASESQRAVAQQGADAALEQQARHTSVASVATAEKLAKDEAESLQIESTRVELLSRAADNTASSAALIVASSLSIKDRMAILHEQKDKWLLHYKKSLDDWSVANQTVAEQYDLTSTLTLIQSRREALRQKGLLVG